jgi:hypothetical protein
VDVAEVVAILGKNVGLLDREATNDRSANGLGKASEIVGVALALGQAVLLHQVGGIRDELTIVGAEILPGHVAIIPSTVDESLEIVHVVATSATEVGIAEANFLPKLVEGSGTSVLVTFEARDVAPRVSL